MTLPCVSRPQSARLGQLADLLQAGVATDRFDCSRTNFMPL